MGADIVKRVENQSTMEKALSLLRNEGFVFASYETLIQWDFKLRNKNAYSYMVKEIKPGTIKERGEYDMSLIFGIKLNGPKTNWIRVYNDGKFDHSIKMPWKDQSNILWRKIKASLKFPSAMTHDERKKWRAENNKLKRNPDYEPKDIYTRWDSQVERIINKKG